MALEVGNVVVHADDRREQEEEGEHDGGARRGGKTLNNALRNQLTSAQARVRPWL